MENKQLLLVLVVAAVCGLAAGQNSFGTSYGDTGSDAPYLQSLSPPEGPKQGGTQITLQGAGFRDDSRALCRFSRLNPNTETTITKTTASTYVSSTEVTCPSPDWEEDSCPSCAGSTALSGTFTGHTGSPYLRGSSNVVPSEIGVGDYIQLGAATAAGATLIQYYQIKAIQACTAVNGCYCSGAWTTGHTPTSVGYSVTVSYNGTGAHTDSADKGFEIMTPDTTNCALYKYDKMTGGAGDTTSSIPTAMWPNAGGADCTPQCMVPWSAGTMITLSEPVYKIDGKANVAFSGKKGYRATKFSCTSCKCAGGCVTTVSHTNDGVAFSGGGIGGEVWSGSALAFSLKDIVPSVAWITHNLPGYRDSTRIFGSASGGTTITVVGKNFQDSPLLRCYFAGVRTLVKAEWIDSEHVRCRSPPFFSRQLDDSGAEANQDGSALNPHSKVHVTNDGMIHDCYSSGCVAGKPASCTTVVCPGGMDDHISRNPHLSDDGSKTYIRTFAATATYTSGEVGHAGNPYRSTCQEGLYPNEGNKPCYEAHRDSVKVPDSTGAAATGTYSAGNDVLFKYATCYDANPAGLATSLNLYGTTPTSQLVLNSTLYPYAQQITITGDTQTGPLSHMQFHFEKPTDLEAKLKINVCAGAACVAGGTNIAEETVLVSKIVPTAANFAYNVFFTQPPYLLANTPYYVQVSLVSGATDVAWKMNTDSATGYYANHMHPTGFQFRLKGYTCDGCRTKYQFAPADPKTDLIFGDNPPQDENGGSTYFTSASTSRSMLAQELRPTETGTITHTTLDLQNVLENSVNQAYVSVWITKYAKYGEYVCSAVAGVQTSLDAVCDTDMDGTFNQACVLGSICDPSLALNGGCGAAGSCTIVETATNGHRLRPEPNANNAGPCGDSALCDLTMTLAPDHQQIVVGANGPTTFEFKTPVPVEKHTTYFVNVAVVGNPDVSKPVIWKSGVAHGDGGVKDAGSVAYTTNGGIKDTQTPDSELRASFTRDKSDGKWKLNTERVFAIKFKRCVSSTAQVFGFTTTGDRTGCCSARASPQGGDKGATITVTGRNFFPGDKLACVFRAEDGVSAAAITAGTTIDASYTKMTCPAPTLNPHSSRDCTNPALCHGVTLVVTNDGGNVGPQFLGPKWNEPTSTSAVPAYLGLTPLKFLFSEIHVSVTGSDTVGDGTIARPYNTIQKGVDAANEFDQIVLLSGVYTGIGNRGLRHHGKKIELKARNGDRQNTIIDCQHAPDGFILNNNKDSDSPFAGFIDTQDIITRNCENLRIYDI